MRRVVVVATAFAVLIAAASAYAATGGFNTYGANLKFSPNKAGSGKSPAAGGFTENYSANGTGGNRTAPLTDIKTTIYGMVTNGKDFPTCSMATIANNKSDAKCPKGALVATGSVTAVVGPDNDQSATAMGVGPCNPILHAWNAGQGKVVFFFVDQGSSHSCYFNLITTGHVGPFPGTIKQVGKTLVMDTPIPHYVSFPGPGLEGSLTSETLTWKNLTTKLKNGKTVAYGASVGCKNGKRPYSVKFTAASGGQQQSQTESGTQKCTK